MANVMNNANEQEEEFLSMPPTTVIDAKGMRKIAEVEANDEAHRATMYQEIRFRYEDRKNRSYKDRLHRRHDQYGGTTAKETLEIYFPCFRVHDGEMDKIQGNEVLADVGKINFRKSQRGTSNFEDHKRRGWIRYKLSYHFD